MFFSLSYNVKVGENRTQILGLNTKESLSRSKLMFVGVKMEMEMEMKMKMKMASQASS